MEFSNCTLNVNIEIHSFKQDCISMLFFMNYIPHTKLYSLSTCRKERMNV